MLACVLCYSRKKYMPRGITKIFFGREVGETIGTKMIGYAKGVSHLKISRVSKHIFWFKIYYITSTENIQNCIGFSV